MDADRLIVGANGFNNAKGSVYVFIQDPDNGTWSQQQKLTAKDGARGDLFGTAVSISGDVVVVGADEDDEGEENSGSIYVFTLAPGTSAWTQQQKLTAADASEGNRLGRAVSVDRNVLAVGGRRTSYIFTRDTNTTNWSQQQKLTSQGQDVSVSGKTVAIGDAVDDEVEALQD